jgi:hypothetical protein
MPGYSCGLVGITSADGISVKKSPDQVDRRKHNQWVSLDRRKHDDDLAERMTCGIRTWSSQKAGRSPFIKKSQLK